MLTKTIKIDDKEVLFAASAAIPRIYRIQFRRDIFQDMAKIEKSVKKSQDKQTETKVSESDTEESTAQERKEENNTVEKAVEAPPLGAILDKRTEEIRNVVFGAMAQYGIPASLMDYMLTSVLSEVRDLKSKEYSDCLVNKGE